jgi:hypothetical protein
VPTLLGGAFFVPDAMRDALAASGIMDGGAAVGGGAR